MIATSVSVTKLPLDWWEVASTIGVIAAAFLGVFALWQTRRDRIHNDRVNTESRRVTFELQVLRDLLPYALNFLAMNTPQVYGLLSCLPDDELPGVRICATRGASNDDTRLALRQELKLPANASDIDLQREVQAEVWKLIQRKVNKGDLSRPSFGKRAADYLRERNCVNQLPPLTGSE